MGSKTWRCKKDNSTTFKETRTGEGGRKRSLNYDDSGTGTVKRLGKILEHKFGNKDAWLLAGEEQNTFNTAKRFCSRLNNSLYGNM